MAYIASKRFTNTPKGTEDQTDYEPGDPIPDFESWPENARHVLIKQNYVTPSFAVPLTDDAEDTAEDAEVGVAAAGSKKRAVSKKK